MPVAVDMSERSTSCASSCRCNGQSCQRDARCYEKVSSAHYTIIVRGDVSEVQVSVIAGVDAVKRVNTEVAPTSAN